tara:strand:+ start:10869 stop:11270 length:402 start_codon:yes stop_codon:yes gene_type:complete
MKIILFDGHCNLCNSWVRYIVKRDHSKKIKFASLQSTSAKKILGKNKVFYNNLESIVLVEDGKYYFKSTAAIKIISLLDSWERHLKFLILIPAPIRDFFYSLVAKYRYKWFGKSEVCMIPSSDIEERFLTDLK